MGGSEHTLPIQARVMRFGFQPWVPPQLASTTGTGESILPGFQECFPPFNSRGTCLCFPEGTPFCRIIIQMSFNNRLYGDSAAARLNSRKAAVSLAVSSRGMVRVPAELPPDSKASDTP